MQKSRIIKEPSWFLIDRVLRDRPGGHTNYRNAYWSKKDRRKQRREQKRITREAVDSYYEESNYFYECLDWEDRDDWYNPPLDLYDDPDDYGYGYWDHYYLDHDYPVSDPGYSYNPDDYQTGWDYDATWMRCQIGKIMSGFESGRLTHREATLQIMEFLK